MIHKRFTLYLLLLPFLLPCLCAEDESRDIMEKIERLKVIPGMNFSPSEFIDLAKTLVKSGKTAAISSLRAYESSASKRPGYDPYKTIFLARYIFSSADGNPLRKPGIGVSDLVVPSSGKADTTPERFPLVIVDDAVVFVANAFLVVGKRETPDEYLDYCEREGIIDDRVPLTYRAPKNIDSVINEAKKSSWWKSVNSDEAEKLIRAQLAR